MMIDSNNFSEYGTHPIIYGNTDWRKREKTFLAINENLIRKQGLDGGKFGSCHANDYSKWITSGMPLRCHLLEETPELILDAPGLIDDFYSSPIDSRYDESESRLAVALLSSVYIYSIEQKRLCRLQSNTNEKNITAVKWISSNHLAATQGSSLEVWDTLSLKECFIQKTNNNRIVALESLNENVILTGSEKGEILLFDIRVSGHVQHLDSSIHTQEICGLAMTPKFVTPAILASGSNDNSIGIWDLRMLKVVFKINHHTSAVKALGWKDGKLLLTGGGTSDRRLVLWDAKETGTMLDEHDTGAQITHLIWPFSNSNKAVVAHGYPSAEGSTMTADLTLWDISIQSLKQIQRIPSAHSGRVLHLASIPGKVISCGADETLRFWHMLN